MFMRATEHAEGDASQLSLQSKKLKRKVDAELAARQAELSSGLLEGSP
jgi:hypothetical protein